MEIIVHTMIQVNVLCNMQGGTARIVFSWSDVDPIGNNPIAISAHGPSRRGTKSINLLGENQDPPLNPPGSSSFRITVTNVSHACSELAETSGVINHPLYSMSSCIAHASYFR